MGIVAHFWNPEKRCAESAALDIVQLNEHPSLEFVADTLKNAFDKTDLNPAIIYRTIVESSGSRKENGFRRFSLSNLKVQPRNYSTFYVGSCASYRLRTTLDDIFSADSEVVCLREVE
jgi:hypothetical protein